ncbi:MAG: DUF3617 domain-containing protein [Steroidobacteraceae bacterium]
MHRFASGTAIALLAVAVAACGQTPAGTVAAAPGDGTLSSAAGAVGTAHLGAPQRRSGWWTFTATTSRGTPMGKQNLCVSAETEARFSAFDQITQEQLLGYKCSKVDFHRAAGGWAFDVACDTGIAVSEGGGIVASQGTISGDISSSYEIKMTVRQAGEVNTGTIKATLGGSCPSGRKPGDLVVDDSQTLNVLAD